MAENRQSVKPRILVVDTSPAVTGALNSALRSCEYLRASFDFTFLIPSGSIAAQTIREHGFTVSTLPFRELRKKPGSIAVYLPSLLVNGIRLRRMLRRGGFHVVLVNDIYNLVPSVAAWMGSGVPLITYVRFVPSRFPSALVGMWIKVHEKTSSCFVAVSRAVERELQTSLPVHVVPNEIPSYQAGDYDPQSTLVLFPANFVKGKGQEYALHAFAKIHRDFAEWRLRFVGGDLGLQKNRDFKAELQLLSKTLGIESKVEWLDFQTDMRSQYEASSFVLVLSDSESFSMVCLEAMHCSRPVIATRCGGPEEIIDDHKDGLLVALRDVDATAKGMIELMNNAEFRGALGEAARKKVEDTFSMEKSAGRLSEIYKSTLR
jgi:glycosyltransferase involved in cell wall biosynthesis